ncbi:MAG: S24 family peptidase [Treponema sp.]|nr:S24 family peptidase [Treponema sp.]
MYEDLIERVKHAFHIHTDVELQELIGAKNSYINKLRNGTNKHPELLLNWLKEKGLDENYFLNGKSTPLEKSDAPMIEVHSVPLLRQKVSCGPGISWDSEDNIECYIEPIGIIPNLKYERIYAFRAKGISMLGAGISDGDILFFNGSYDQQIKDGIYVFGLAGEAYCKLLRFEELTKKVHIYSLHKADLKEAELIRTIDFDSDDFHIFGRVLAWLHENTILTGL